MKRNNILTEYGALLALVILFVINVITRKGNFLQMKICGIW